MKQLSPISILLILLVVGFLIIAIIDENYRTAFVDLTFTGVGAFLAYLYPQQPPKKVTHQS